MVPFPPINAVFFKDWILDLKLQPVKQKLYFFQNMQCILSRCSTPLKEAQLSFMFESNTISLNIGNTPFKETQLPSIWTGTLLIWTKGFTHQKENWISCPFCVKIIQFLWTYVALLSTTPFLWTYATLLSKKPSYPLFGQEQHLFERKASLTTRRIVYSQRPHT